MATGDSPASARRRLRQALRRARDAAGLTQGEVSDSLHWSLSKVQRIESGDVTISVTDVSALLRLFDVHDSEQSVIGLFRKGADAGDIILIAFNFTPLPRHNYRFGVPRAGDWAEVLNSDATLYGGSGQGNIGGVPTTPVGWHGHLQSVNLTLPPLGMIALKWMGKRT